MEKKKSILKAFLALVIFFSLLASGVGTQKSYARQKCPYTYEVNFNVSEFIKEAYKRMMKDVCRIQDAPYKAMLDYAYGMTENLQYEFIGDTIVTVAANKGFLKRNFYESVALSDEEGGFYVRNERMDKAVHFINEKGVVFSLYYRNLNDSQPSYVAYRYESKKNSDFGGFFIYNMRGQIEDAWFFDEVWAPRSGSAFYVDSYRCKELVPFINKMMESGRQLFAGPSVIKLANNSAYLKRNYKKEVTLSTDEEFFIANNERMAKEVKYSRGDNDYIALYYRNEKDSVPAYVGYVNYSGPNAERGGSATFDMRGKNLSYGAPYLVGKWYYDIEFAE